MIYKLGVDIDPFEANPGLKVVEEFAKLQPRQMTFVCLVCDPSRDNPVGTLTGKDRREKAAKVAGYKYESDGKRLDKNGRSAVYGQVKSIETAIATFKELHYNPRQRSIDALRKQIEDIRNILESDKMIPIVNRKGEAVLDGEGKTLLEIDGKAVKLSVELSKDLPGLEDQLEKMIESNKEDDTVFEGATYTASDLDEDGEEDNVPAIERFHNMTNE